MDKSTVLDKALLNDLELVEARAWGDLYRYAPSQIASALGIKLAEMGNAILTTAAEIDILGYNRVIALGVQEAANANLIEDVISTYREAGVKRFFVQICQEVTSPDWHEILLEKGFTRHNNWVKLYRPIDPPININSDVRVERIDHEKASKFADILVTSFDWPEEMVPWVASLVGHQGWHHYLAFRGDVPIGTGSFYAEGDYAWIDFASTLPEYRGHGAQGCMVQKRIADARDLGCKWLMVETAEQTPEKEAPSYRNMIRYGFKIAYIRPNYLYTF